MRAKSASFQGLALREAELVRERERASERAREGGREGAREGGRGGRELDGRDGEFDKGQSIIRLMA